MLKTITQIPDAQVSHDSEADQLTVVDTRHTIFVIVWVEMSQINICASEPLTRISRGSIRTALITVAFTRTQRPVRFSETHLHCQIHTSADSAALLKLF